MTKINHEEYEILRDSWKWWIARDENGELYRHEEKPKKFAVEWVSARDYCLYLDSETFQFIQWEDSEPYSIAELIEGYEKEREETEVKKDIEWAKNKIDLEVIRRIGREDPHFYVSVGLKRALDFLNQIDEPETLSSDWISDNVEYAYYMTPKGTYSSAKAVIDPNKLKNTLVPKQEKVKIESVWAEDIEDAKASGMTLFKTMDWMAIDSDDKEKQDLFARAWLDGYTVEEELLYRARLKVVTNQFIASYLRTQSSEAEDRLKTLEIGRKYIHEDDRSLSEFTEDELKKLDIWDSDQWEIEEVEENAKN